MSLPRGFSLDTLSITISPHLLDSSTCTIFTKLETIQMSSAFSTSILEGIKSKLKMIKFKYRFLLAEIKRKMSQ
jgi:hypothetical protein